MAFGSNNLASSDKHRECFWLLRPVWANWGFPLTELERYMVVVDQTTLVLLAFGTLGLLASFLLFNRISRAVRVNRILKGGNRILKADGHGEPGRPAQKGWTVGLNGPFPGKERDKTVERTFRNVF